MSFQPANTMSTLHQRRSRLAPKSLRYNRTSSKNFNIQRLPPEIRVIIFREYMIHSDEAYDGKTPLLVKALRVVPQLYQEALEAW
jgi:hypothetical protein